MWNTVLFLGPSTVFSTTRFYGVLHLIMTETGYLGTGSSEACGRSRKRSILGSILVNSEVNPEVNLRSILDPFLDPS